MISNPPRASASLDLRFSSSANPKKVVFCRGREMPAIADFQHSALHRGCRDHQWCSRFGERRGDRIPGSLVLVLRHSQIATAKTES
jgi:hypothetical protein